MTVKDTCDRIRSSGDLGDGFKKPKTRARATEFLGVIDEEMRSIRTFTNDEKSSSTPWTWGAAKVKTAYLQNRRLFLLDFIKRK